MARAARSAGAGDGSPGGGTDTIEAVVFEGRASQRIDLTKAAPFGWGTAILLGGVGMVDRIDSSLVGGAYDILKKHFHFNDLVGGVLLAAPVWASLLLVIPAGIIADRKRRTTFIAAVTASWGLLTFGAALAPTLAAFFVARILLGAATPLNIPSSSSIVGDLYPSTSRVKAFGILRAMEFLGLPLGVALGGVAAAGLGWRGAFALMGVPALVVAAIVAVKIREPRRGVGDEISAEIDARAGDDAVPVDTATSIRALPDTDLPDDVALRSLDGGDEDPIGVVERVRQVFSIRSARYIVLGQAFLFAGFSGLFSFAASFFHRTHGIEEGKAAALVGSIGLLTLIAGAAYVIGRRGRVQDIRGGRRVNLPAQCFVVSVVSVAVIAAVNILAVQLLAFAALNIANIIAITNLGAAIADVIPANKRGSGFAVTQFCLTIGAGCGSIIVGFGSFVAGDQIRWGIAALVIPLFIGTVLIFRARASYPADAAKVLEAAMS